MKTFLILLFVVTSFVSCNNTNDNSRERDRRDYREADDYNSDDNNDRDKERSNTDFNNDTRQKENGRGARWTADDIDAFELKCLETLNGNREAAFSICPCLLTKMQQQYGSLSEMDDRSTAAEGERMTKECMKNMPAPSPENSRSNSQQQNEDYSTGGTWSSGEVKKFVNDCVGAAEKGGMESLDAQSYCDCMQYKIERLYPNPADANRITQADLSTPSMKKMIKDCLPARN